MAKTAIINRNLKRIKIVKKYSLQRLSLKKFANDMTLTEDERVVARNKLQKLPKDSSAVRIRNRCLLTGRPRGVFSKFGLGRIKLRDIAMSGKIPGIIKASW